MEKKRTRRKKRLGSYPYASVIFSITLALFVIGLFGLLILNTHKLSELIKEKVEVQVYLQNRLSESQIIGIQKTLADKDFTLIKNQEPQITFISKEQALEKFGARQGEDPENFLGYNPLRDAYLVKIRPEFQDSIQMTQVKAEIESINGVFEASYMDNIIADINKNSAKIGLILLGFAVILIITVIILINNTIKLALFSQRFLIRSMQLVGATSGFIQKPFLLRSVFHGILSGILASALVYAIYQYAISNVTGLASLQDQTKMLILFGILVLTGALIGLFSTARAIRKYLKMSLDDLY